MKINWLWDSRVSEKEVKKILKDESHSKFDMYAEKLLSRVNEPKVVFAIIDKESFCRRWPYIKKRIKKDLWAKERVVFWQTMYERIYETLKKQGIKVRQPLALEGSPERMKLAQQIRDIRMKVGYTQNEMAKRLGVIQQYISKIETGHENVSIDTLRRIADVLGKQVIITLQ